MNLKDELVRMLVRKSFKHENKPVFRLASGKMSRFYVNCKPTTWNSRGAYLVSELVYRAVRGLNVDAIGGLEKGADPIALSAALAFERHGKKINAFSIRKKKKGHGLKQEIDGAVMPGDRVVIIDDVATTGGSTVKAIKDAQGAGLTVVKVIILVDRQEGGLRNIKKHIKDTVAIINRKELKQEYLKKGRKQP